VSACVILPLVGDACLCVHDDPVVFDSDGEPEDAALACEFVPGS